MELVLEVSFPVGKVEVTTNDGGRGVRALGSAIITLEASRHLLSPFL